MKKPHLVMLLVLVCVASVAAVWMRRPHESDAAFHLAEISEVMVGTTGDPTVEYVEINMLATGQTVTANTRLSAWNADGTFFGVLLLVPGNVPVSGSNAKWIMATSSFAAASGINSDFTFAAASLPSTGMICWGAPGVIPPNPATWDPSLPTNYVDCVPYGGYAAANIRFGPAEAAGPGDGEQSLTRMAHTDNTQNDFALACPSPRNNAGQNGTIGTCGQPTATPTPTHSPTPTATPTPCVSPDGDSDGICDALDNCPADSNASQTNSDSGPPPPAGNVGAIGNGVSLAGNDGTVPNGDTAGDPCDLDADNDGIDNGSDLAPGTPRDITIDDDGDGIAATGCYGGTDTEDNGVSWDRNCDGKLDGAPADCGSTTADADNDGLRDSWETCHWGTSNISVNTDGDATGDCREAFDVNGNGSVTNSDGVFAKQVTFGVAAADWTFDVNGNGAITNSDGVLIQQAVFGVIVCV